MPWELSIHHLALEDNGDSTLIVAKQTFGGGVIDAKSILIDGGFQQDYKENLKEFLDKYLPPGHSLDALVVTHYDSDHTGGITALLQDNLAKVKSGARLYDQGNPNIAVEAGSGGTNKRARNPKVTFISTGDQGPYLSYKQAIEKRSKPVNRVSEYVCSMNGGEVDFDPKLVQAGYDPPDYLIGKDILWEGNEPPIGAPTAEIVAANYYVKTGPQANQYQKGNSDNEYSDEAKNCRSLGILVRFGNFKYFIGGDMETAQEDLLANYLGQVDVIKASHHGSNKSTSTTFLERTQPRAAIISCGWGTKNKKPTHPPGVNTLERLINENPTPTFQNQPLIFFTNHPGEAFINLNFTPEQQARFRISGAQNQYGDVSLYVGYAGSLENQANFQIEYFDRAEQAAEGTEGMDIQVTIPNRL
ncbi:MAG: MBL fold metallo-hydrolase [Bacteroidota bacterium]